MISSILLFIQKDSYLIQKLPLSEKLLVSPLRIFLVILRHTYNFGHGNRVELTKNLQNDTLAVIL